MEDKCILAEDEILDFYNEFKITNDIIKKYDEIINKFHRDPDDLVDELIYIPRYLKKITDNMMKCSNIYKKIEHDVNLVSNRRFSHYLYKSEYKLSDTNIKTKLKYDPEIAKYKHYLDSFEGIITYYQNMYNVLIEKNNNVKKVLDFRKYQEGIT
jgi:translation initiation factor 2 beta subunit (eIF-2beta)/eIF-5